MGYTIADLDDAIRDENSEWEGSWYEFSDFAERTSTYLEDDNGDLVRGEDGRLIRVPLEVPGVTLPGIGHVVLVESFGGEGQGDSLWFVFKVTDESGNERLFRRNGWYQSFNGGEYDGPTEEVKAVEKTITVFVTI